MKIETLTALKDSIAHWKRMLELKTQEQRYESDEVPDGEQCGLCNLFNSHPHVCDGCPVYASTGFKLCGGTPYHEAHDAFIDGSDDEWQRACQAEIDFLESLLPQPKHQ